ncbi:MAG: nicotinate-nucleotide adenylyltransferase [Lachnospiraceae bacterium]
MKKIGIMGGTFDPVHNGHLLIAENAYEQLSLDEVRFIPTGRSPHKQGTHITDGQHRLRMVELAIADNPAFVADARELRSDALSYSYVTLQKMHEKSPNDELYFIMGGDSLRDFKTWYHPELICSCATLVAAIRDDCDHEHLTTYAEELHQLFSADVRLIQTPNLSVSSSELRRRVAVGETIRYQVPEAVRAYIQNNRLYRDS